MRFSIAALAALLLTSSGPLCFASTNTASKPDTLPNSTPTKTARQTPVRETSPNLLGTLFEIANNFDLRACVPAALPLITALPKIPPALIKQGAIKQALSQTTRGLDRVCDFSVTGSVGDTFTAFLPTWYSWYHRYSDRVASVITKCPKAGALVNTMEAYATCPQVIAQISSASATATDAESGGSRTTVPPTSHPSETVSTDSPSATHETGLFGAAAAAAAGVLGVAAIL
ncbi:hypothetical protein F4861DRAFT_301650 [Xylaria intraflava]|nr:hypothetical protein F4861DRAFT_301650 [Xylaria intraflava]